MRHGIRRVLVVAFMALLFVSAQPVSAANVTIASENTNETDFGNATTLEDFTVTGSGDSAYIHYEGGGSYLSAASAHWSLDQNENPAVDEVQGLNANFQNSPTYVSGLTGSGALDFQDADNDHLAVSEPFDPATQSQYSLSAHVKPNEVSGEGTVFWWDGGIIVRYQAGNWRFYHKDDSNTWNLIAETPATAGAEARLGMSWDGSTVEAYVNGTQVGSASHSTMMMAGDTGQLGIGYPISGNDFGFNGVIDEPRIWNGHLSDNQFSTLNNDPSARLGGSADGNAEYVGQAHDVSEALDGKVNLSSVSQATAYVEWQYHDGTSWQTHTNNSYTTSGVKTADLSTQQASQWRTRVYVTDSDTNGAVDVQGDWVTFENNNPTVDNTSASPTGVLESQNPTFSIDVADTDFGTSQGDSVNASLYIDGEYRGSDVLTSDGTAEVTAQVAGSINYHWELADDYGGSATSDTFSTTTPAILYVFNETAPHNLVDNVQINATATGETGTVDLQTTDTGKVSLAGLPANQSYVFTLNAPGYYPREVYINDLYEQQAVYMVAESTPSVSNRITITDRTGDFDEGTVILVDRVINTSTIEQTPDNGPQWVTMGGDRLGTSGFYNIDLQTFSRYRFRVLNSDGGTRVLGEYTAKQDGDVNLQIGSVSYTMGDADSYQWDAGLANETDGNYSITYAYNDHTGSTENVTAVIKYKDNDTVFARQEFTNGPYGEVVYTVPVNQTEYENHSFVVEWSATRNGEVITGSRHVSGNRILDLPADRMWQTVAYAVLVLVLALLVAAGAGPAPALVTIGLAAGLGVYIGLAPPALGMGSVMLVLAIAGVYTIRNGARGV